MDWLKNVVFPYNRFLEKSYFTFREGEDLYPNKTMRFSRYGNTTFFLKADNDKPFHTASQYPQTRCSPKKQCFRPSHRY